MVAQNNDLHEKPFLLLVNHNRAEQGLPEVDPGKQTILILPSYQTGDKEGFKKACCAGLVENTGSANYSVKAVQAKLAELHAKDCSGVSVDVISPGKLDYCGYHALSPLKAEATSLHSAVRVDFYPETVNLLTEQVNRLKSPPAIVVSVSTPAP